MWQTIQNSAYVHINMYVHIHSVHVWTPGSGKRLHGQTAVRLSESVPGSINFSSRRVQEQHRFCNSDQQSQGGFIHTLQHLTSHLFPQRLRFQPKADSPSWAGCPQQHPSWRPGSDSRQEELFSRPLQTNASPHRFSQFVAPPCPGYAANTETSQVSNPVFWSLASSVCHCWFTWYITGTSVW